MPARAFRRACWREPGIQTPGVSSKCQDKDQPTADSLLLLPDGYSDVPAGKIAAVVTHLKMTGRPAIPRDPAGTWSLRTAEAPGLALFVPRNDGILVCCCQIWQAEIISVQPY